MTRSIQTETRVDCDICSNYYVIEGKLYEYPDDNNSIANWHCSVHLDLCGKCWNRAQPYIEKGVVQWTERGQELITRRRDPFYAESKELANDN